MKARMKKWLRPALFTLGGRTGGTHLLYFGRLHHRLLRHYLQSVHFRGLYGAGRLASLQRVWIRQLSEKQQTINRIFILKQNSRKQLLAAV